MSFKYKNPNDGKNDNSEQDALFLSIRSTLIAIVLAIITLSIMFAPAPSHAKSIYQQKMLRLNEKNHSVSQMQTLAPYEGNPMLTAFFMPDCRWCQRQHKVLKKLQHHCQTIQTVMLGVQGTKHKLRQELQREKNSFPAYIANNTLVQAIGKQSPVPMVLFFNAQGSLIFKTVGYASESKLFALFKRYNFDVCNA